MGLVLTEINGSDSVPPPSAYLGTAADINTRADRPAVQAPPPQISYTLLLITRSVRRGIPANSVLRFHQYAIAHDRGTLRRSWTYTCGYTALPQKIIVMHSILN